jgi:glycosyltransferase involved in cell wall biosynthesis
MKVVSVLTSDASGGAEFATVELLDALAERGHDVVLLANFPPVQDTDRIAIRPIDLGPKLSRATYGRVAVRFPALARRLRRELARELPFDVLLLHFKKEQLLTLALPRASRQTCVWAEWGPVPREFRRGLPNLLYRRAARRADLVLAISAGTKDSLVEAGIPEDKVVVLPNAVRTDEIRYDEDGRSSVRAQLGIPMDAFVVGCVSRFHPKKRNDVVIEAVARMNDQVHVVMAGAGETEQQLRELARPLGDRAHFLPTPTDEIAQVLSCFDVSVFCPSPTEGAPRAVILAMLAERPVVATGAEGVADLIPEDAGRILAPENDPDALADVLREYALDPRLRAEHGAAGRRSAETRHAASVVAERLERLFETARTRRAEPAA